MAGLNNNNNISINTLNIDNINLNENNTKLLVNQANIQPQQQQQQLQPQQQQKQQQNEQLKTYSKQIDYINGRVKSEPRVNYETYYSHREPVPNDYHPLVQYLDRTELKYYNDNLFYETPLGFPTKACILRDNAYRLPIIKDSLPEKARYRRKLHEKQQNIALARKKYDFKTYEGNTSHYFLTGARYNRYDTIDSKILNKYGIFVNRNNTELIYFKSKTSEPLVTESEVYQEKPKNEIEIYKNKSIQVPQLDKDLKLIEKRFNANLTF